MNLRKMVYTLAAVTCLTRPRLCRRRVSREAGGGLDAATEENRQSGQGRNNTMGGTLAAAVLTVSLIFVAAGSANAATLYAATWGADNYPCGTSTAPCRSVSYAMNMNGSGTTVVLMDEGDFGPISLVTGVNYTKVGQGPGSKVTRNPAAEFCVKLWGNAGNLVLRDLTVGGDAAGFGIDFQAGASLTLENVVVSNQTGTFGMNFRPAASASLIMKNVTFENNGSGGSGGAVLLNTASGVVGWVDISDSLFTRSSRGIVVQGPGNVQLSVSNTTIANSSGHGIHVTPAAGAIKLSIKDSQIVNNGGTGVYVGPTGSAKVDATVNASSLDNNANIGIAALPGGSSSIAMSIADTSVSGNAWGGIYASGKSNFGIIRANIASNGYGITAASPATVRVGSSMINGNYLGLSGPVSSYGNNQLLGNTTQGSATTVPPAGKP